jgi:hypothetical protein
MTVTGLQLEAGMNQYVFYTHTTRTLILSRVRKNWCLRLKVQ